MSTPRKRMRQSKRQERAVAKELGGGRVPWSGSGDEKGDGRVPMVYRVENKGTTSDQYRLTSNEWEKLWKQAVSANEQPVFHIRLLRDTTALHEYVVLETHFAEELLDTELGGIQSSPQRSILIRYDPRVEPDMSWDGVPYQRTLLSPVRRLKLHDITVWPWSNMKRYLSDYSNQS